MIQYSSPLPHDMPVYVEGHHPQLVQTRGTPTDARVGAYTVHTWHIECDIECHQRQRASLPHVSRAIAESRWRADPATHCIPLSERGRARVAAAAAKHLAGRGWLPGRVSRSDRPVGS